MKQIIILIIILISFVELYSQELPGAPARDYVLRSLGIRIRNDDTINKLFGIDFTAIEGVKEFGLVTPIIINLDWVRDVNNTRFLFVGEKFGIKYKFLFVAPYLYFNIQFALNETEHDKKGANLRLFDFSNTYLFFAWNYGFDITIPVSNSLGFRCAYDVTNFLSNVNKLGFQVKNNRYPAAFIGVVFYITT